MKLYFVVILLFLALFGCINNDSKTNANYAYIGGKIINPNTNFILLENHETIIDTIKLDDNNRFLYKVENLKKSLYTFRHGGEIQMVLLESKDSILFRLNTLEFDESLVFTGEGSKKNNYLINEFLQNEVDEKKIFKLCQLNPQNYQNHVDSLRLNKIEKLERFKKKYKTSSFFDKIAQSNIDYCYYSSKEIYPFVHYGKNKKAILKSLPKDFYSYRKNVNYNDEFLNNYYNYNAFLRHYLSNLALNLHVNHSNEDTFHRTSICYNLDRLKLIDSLVSDVKMKDDLLYHYAIKYISRGKNKANNTAILNSFLNKSENDEKKKTITRYTNASNNLKHGDEIPKIKIIDYDNKEFEISTLINSPTIICFWSHVYYNHFKKSHRKINELKVKYPEIKFIVINIDNYGLERSKKSLKGNRFTCKDEYFFKNPKSSKEILAIYPMTKTLLLDENRKIVNSNSNIFSRRFEEQLLGLINN